MLMAAFWATETTTSTLIPQAEQRQHCESEVFLRPVDDMNNE